MNSAINGVFLPTDPTNNPNNSTLHIGSHKTKYHKQVYKYIKQGIKKIEKTGKKVGKQDIYNLLDELGKQLENGKLKLN